MALGDFVDIKLKSDDRPHRVMVKRAGGTFAIDGIGPAGRGQAAPDFITVTVYGQTHQKIEEVYFARSEVVSIVNGSQSVAERRRAK